MEKVKEKLEVNKKFEKTHSQLVECKNLVRKTETSGITLIALVITIIVLLILAAVSIATLTGDNGILTKANTAKTTNDSAQAEEEMKLLLADWQLEKRSNSSADLGDFLNKKLENGELDNVTDNKDGSYTIEKNGYDATISDEDGLVQLLNPGDTANLTQKNNYVDGNEDKATIPEGFTVSKEDNTIDTGLVVTAPDGSEFVWVPVPKAIYSQSPNEPPADTTEKAMAVKQEDGTYRGLLYDFKGTGADSYSEIMTGCTATDFNGNREPAYLSGTDFDDNSTNNPGYFNETSLKNEYKEMIESVEEYGGFYVGRYETSLTEDKSNVASKGGETPMSSATDSGNRWYGMYNKQKKYASSIKVNEKEVVGSSMIWGSQYDAMLNCILTGTDKSKVTAASTSHSKTTTGSTSNDVMNKIYDLGNNLCEWTLEGSWSVNRVSRGSDSDNNNSPSNRGVYFPYGPYGGHGSRLTLYIK